MRTHLVWAARLAWRKRLWFGVALGLLALVGVVLGLPRWVVLVGVLAWLYPTRREVPRALSEIDRYGLAYRAALEADPADPKRPRLLEDARAQLARMRLPSWPLPALSAYLLVLALALVVPSRSWTASPPVEARQQPPQVEETSAPKPQTESGAPAEPASSRPQENETAPAPSGETPAETAASPEGRDATPTPSEPQAPPQTGEGEPKGQPSAAPSTEPAAGEAEAGAPDENASAGSPAEPGAPSEATGREPGEAQGQAGEGVAQGEVTGRPEAGAPSPEAPGPEALPGAPDASAGERLPETLLSAESETPTGPLQAGDLPAPWPEGRPPEVVRARAETYLSEEPLPPEVRELVSRYFDLEGP